MLRCVEQIRGKRKKQKSRIRRENRRGNLGRRSSRVNVTNKGEVVEGVTGEVAGVLLVGDLT